MFAKTISALGLLTVLCLTTAPAARAIEPPESIEAAINGALQNHPDIATAQARINQARADYDGVRLEVVRNVVAVWGDLKAKREEVTRWKQEIPRAKDPAAKAEMERQLVDSQAQYERLTTELHYMTQYTGGQGALSSSNAGEPPVEWQVPTSAMARETAHKLASPVELEVFDIPLKDVLEHLAQSSRVNLQIDAQPDIKPVEDMPITLKLQKVSLAGALEALEDITHHRFVIRNYGILLVADYSVQDRGLVPVIKYATEHLGIDLGEEEENLRKAAEAEVAEKK